MSFEENIIEAVWEKASPIEGYDRERFRKDCCGAIIAKDKYGDTDSVFGWQIDHVYPEKCGGKNDLDNLRAMQWQNNESKSDDYPAYYSSVTADGTSNIELKVRHVVNETLQKKLKDLYGI